MTRDCRCHRLFYPYFISSRSANSINTLKTKTTISPVRKNCELHRWKLPKSNLAINQLLSQSVFARKRSFPYDSVEYKLGEFDCVDAFFDEASKSTDLDTNPIMIRSPHRVIEMRPQHHFSKRIASELNSSRVSSSPVTFSNDQTGFETSKNCHGSAYDLFREKENYNNFMSRNFHVANWQATWVEKDQSLSSLNPPTLVPEIIEECEELIFNMSPFTSSQPCSVFSTTDYSDHLNPLDEFDIMEAQKDRPDDDDHEEEDERSISITSVLPIDIPQPQKSI